MYYIINDLDNPSIDEDEDDVPFLEIHEELITNPRRGWHSGAILTDPPLRSIEIEATPQFGYQGPPPDYYDDAISLMSPRLAKILTEAGVDNIYYYPVNLTYRKTDIRYDWLAFNIVGLISAVDDTKSDITNPDGKNLINSTIKGFSIDSSKTHDQFLFRLAENVMITLVHKNIKNAIENAGINTFSFSKPEDCVIV